MLTRRGLKSSDVLLAGKLYLHRNGGRRRPYLGVEVWCPACKGAHVHSWFDAPFRRDLVSHRHAHCPAGPFAAAGYFVGLDPAHDAHNDAVAVAHLSALTAYLSRHDAAHCRN